MFTFSGRFRRRVAVLTVLAMVTSVLVVAAPAAAADPEADYKATFSACVGDAAEDAGFTDVPSGHANAGDINCIAYYGVTKGTSASTYSPLMSVDREQMALFLTRLAGLVGIDVDDDPADPGFTDTSGLSGESQAAIAQLADLGITRGTSATTYSPADNVSRGQMALFVARLMNQMMPQADGEIGLSSTEQFGYLPSDVDANDMDANVDSPFTDIDTTTTKEEFDSITWLYELGVAAGISDTSYGPDADITRASMAGFMAAVLDHSNARPAGLSIQATPYMGWGTQEPTVVISYRTDSFSPVEDQAVDVFSSTSANQGLREDGTCNRGDAPDNVNFGDLVDGDCVWDDNDAATDKDGNIVMEDEVLPGNTRVFHAWIGNDTGDKFDADKFDAQTVSVTANHAQDDLKAGSDIKPMAHDAGMGKQVDLRNGDPVTVTAQLTNSTAGDVARSGVSIRVEYRRVGSYTNTHEAVLVTNDDGMVEFPVNGPADGRGDNARADEVIFTELDSNGNPITTSTDTFKIHWIEEDPRLTRDSSEAPVYVLGGNPNVRVTVRLWDQYGNSFRSHARQQVHIGYVDTETGGDADTTSEVRQVISRGYARWDSRIEVAANQQILIGYDVRQLARNSRGEPVRTGGSDTVDELVENYDEWSDLFPGSSASSRQTTIDDFDVTYNDGHVYTTATDSDNDGVPDSRTPIYQPAADDDNDDATAAENDDDIADDPDPILIWTRGATDRAVQRILNDHALDTYVDRHQERTTPNSRTSLAAFTVTDGAITNMDGTDTVQVVNMAASTHVDRTVIVTHVLNDANEFLGDSEADSGDEQTDMAPDLVYSYDDDDIFIDSTNQAGALEVDIDKFESLIDNTANAAANEGRTIMVEVIAYDVDGRSIFRVTGS